MTKNFIIYNSVGKILRCGICSDLDFNIQVSEDSGSDEYIMEGTANDHLQKIVDGEVVNKTQEEIDAENPPPIIPESIDGSFTFPVTPTYSCIYHTLSSDDVSNKFFDVLWNLTQPNGLYNMSLIQMTADNSTVLANDAPVSTIVFNYNYESPWDSYFRVTDTSSGSSKWNEDDVIIICIVYIYIAPPEE
jgi:hypothetical protein